LTLVLYDNYETAVTDSLVQYPLSIGSSGFVGAAGPQAACLGCMGFAAFSLLIEKIFDRHE
jgi:hypothetical protein